MSLTITQAFNEFKSKLELGQSFQEAISTHHNAVREWIESHNSDIKTKLIGSLQRKTRIQPRSKDPFDIDILVIFGEFRSQSPDGISPESALNNLENIIRQHGTYRKLGPETDSPTIVFEYKDMVKVELVPAWKDFICQPKGRGYRIPKRSRWVSVDYDYDAEYISEANNNSNGYLIPTIKMLKAAKRNLFSEMKSYHLEVLATNTIPKIISYYKSEGFQISYPSLVFSFFLLAKDDISKSSKIPGSKSPPPDKYMSMEEKSKFSDQFIKIAEYCKGLISMEGNSSIEKWRELFGEPFPSGK